MFSLKSYNTYHIESFAKHVYFPQSVNEIMEIYKRHTKVVVLGNGSNIILTQSVYENIAFIVIKDQFKRISEVKEGTYAEAGVLLKELSLYAYEHSLSGVETFFDVPASIGGAMIMNTGAYGDEIYDHVQYVDILDTQTFVQQRIDKADIDYGYRYSMFKKMPVIILGACFDLSIKPQAEIKTKMDDILLQRQAKLPYEPSAGSVFKRPNYHITVGEMVEKIGLKGFQIGGAQISPKHGGVIINTNNATGQHILELVEHIKKVVLEQYHVRLELEQILV
ncbi:UDP-N-acetylmuramate dehydrogenase [Cysteiniphilum halobium]|uniref:UDP-N-acetylmuramate dehydrogenase n=1 Tax=Cysteiniphilum halobium TaxID=2219059 RepID=UPI000E65DC75|nr:UDP-N-acetylmuramate dehydrogenase [Cysteiniphilum halobium]